METGPLVCQLGTCTHSYVTYSDIFLNFQESLFYTVAPGAVLAYRESLESLFVYHKVQRSVMYTSQDFSDHSLVPPFSFPYGTSVKLLNHKVDWQVYV
jgi:hypothetical protein